MTGDVVHSELVEIKRPGYHANSEKNNSLNQQTPAEGGGPV